MKIVITGAGSIVFSMSIVNDLSRKPSLDPVDLVLMDIDAEQLGLVTILARRLTGFRSPAMTIDATTSLGPALEGADFVVNAAAVGERALWPGERAIARQYGYWPSKGFRMSGLRNVPLTVSIAREMERRCPHAWLLQHSNPMAGNVGAVSRHTTIKVAGFCHGVEQTVTRLARWIGIDRERVDAEAAGMNHFLFLTKWYVDGQDRMEELLRWSQEDFPQVWDTPEWEDGLDLPGPVSRDLASRLGAFPCNGDEHMSDYFPWYTTTEEARLSFRAKTDYLDRYLARGQDRLTVWQKLVGSDDAEIDAAFSRPSGEAAVDVIEALARPGKNIVVHVIVPNHGCIDTLPWDSGVEVPALVSTDMVRPVGPQQLPRFTVPYIASRMAEEEYEMEASIVRDRELIYRALELDPYTESVESMTGYVKALADFDTQHLSWLS
jgi:alpha-galactosidase